MYSGLKGPSPPATAAPSPRRARVRRPETAELLAAEVDELVCLEAPPDLGAIGFWYGDFAQTPGEELERDAAGPERKLG